MNPSASPTNTGISWAKMGEPYKTWSDLSGNAFPATTSHTITGLEGGQIYKMQVRSDYNGYAGPWAGDAIVVVAGSANDPPSVDAGPDRIVGEGDTVTLSGTASDDDGTDTLAYLWIHDSALDLHLDGANTTTVSFTAPQVPSNTTATFTLTATDPHNATSSDTATVTIADVPGDPSTLPATNNNTSVLDPPVPRAARDIGRITLTSTTPGIIHASWERPAEDPTHYRISWAKAADPFLTYTDLSGNAFPTDPSHTISGLEEGEEYKVTVRARFNGDIAGPWSGEVLITTGSSNNIPAVPDTPQNLRVIPTHDSGVPDLESAG